MKEQFYICDKHTCSDSTIIGICNRPYVGQELFQTWSTKRPHKPETLGIVVRVNKSALNGYDLCVWMNTGIAYHLTKVIS